MRSRNDYIGRKCECSSYSTETFDIIIDQTEPLYLRLTHHPPMCCGIEPAALVCKALRVHEGFQRRSHLTVSSHVGARQLILGSIYSLVFGLFVHMCVSECLEITFSRSCLLG